MSKKLPTIEELVQIFEDRNWTAAQDGGDFTGVEKEAVKSGQCCIIPALLVYEGKFDEVYGNPDFEIADPYEALDEEKYGTDVWEGFDGHGLEESRDEVYELSRGLREALEKSQIGEGNG